MVDGLPEDPSQSTRACVTLLGHVGPSHHVRVQTKN
ncbi:uncharacterized protein G2W53_028043 [Senna tora]|uniref:Uncharacterized protein n=1 Tax=Senna tora TaxID=362788 RepID=A0A834T1E4_9FABA|nr:uncharacterized protein G2W53_028043 [Senna tora]